MASEEVPVKKIILLILVGITFLGCSDNLENTIVTAPTSANDLNKSMPRSSIFCNWLYASKLIDGSIGDDFIFDTTYINTAGREINVYARLKIEPGSFNGIVKIEMIPNAENLSIKLFPEMTFNAEVKLSFIFTGIDVKSFGFNKTGPVDFAFFPDNGGIELIESDFSHVNLPQDQIKVLNARLYHFSRYGWIR